MSINEKKSKKVYVYAHQSLHLSPVEDREMFCFFFESDIFYWHVSCTNKEQHLRLDLEK